MKNPFKYFRRPLLDDVQAQNYINTITTSLKRTFSEFGVSHAEKRDLKKIYGYPEPSEMTFDYFWSQFQMNGLANRIVSMIPRSCWRDGAVLRPDEESKVILLEKEMMELKRRGLYRELEKTDILNRLGEFSVMYIGLPGEPDQEVTKGTALDQVYFAAFNETSVSIDEYDVDVASPRNGLPTMYQLTPGTATGSGTGQAADTRKPFKAHWSRVVHLAEGALSNDLFGIPYLKPIMYRLLDLDKTIGGAAEAFFRNAMQKKVAQVDNESRATAADFVALQELAEKAINEWQDTFGLKGVKFEALTVPNADPEKTEKACYRAASAYTGAPIRILTGEGAGQLAGNEDKASYNQLVNDRQEQLCALWLLAALEAIDRAGLITLPPDFVITWPVPTAMDEKTASEVTLNEARAAELRAKAVVAFMSAPGAESMISLAGFMTTLLALDDEEVAKLTAGIVAGEADGDLEDEVVE